MVSDGISNSVQLFLLLLIFQIKFASFMEVLSKSSMEKISLLMTVDEMEVRAVEKTGGEGTSGGEAVNLLNPEVKSRVIIISPGDIREAVATQKI